MEETTRLDEVTVFGGKLGFLIPHDWEEQWEEQSGDNYYLYSHPGTDSGWFRVSLNTARAVGVTPAQMLKCKLEGRENVTEDKADLSGVGQICIEQVATWSSVHNSFLGGKLTAALGMRVGVTVTGRGPGRADSPITS
jgi:hypothetical protein